VNRHLVRAAVLIAVALALTGCSRAATSGTAPTSPPSVSGTPATSGTAPASPPSVSGAPAGAATTAPATDAGTLDGISQDLNSADSANAQTDTDQHNADQATATSDG
jgi:hypothetical protein